jgi:outer membrane protein OmpA-like peptidoglycan-associated protein/tetratricopeptide (TPR) repeat protein
MTRFKLYTLFTFVFIAIHFYGAAQVAKPKTSLLALAKTEMGQLRYAYAIPFLKKYIKEGKVDSASLSMLGQCYKMQNRFDSAIYFYQKLDSIVALSNNELAEMYANVGRYDEAISSYRKLLNTQTDSSSATYSLYERRLKGFISRAKYDRDSLDYKLHFLRINTPYNEFGAALLDSGFVFESNRSKKVTRSNEFGWDGLPFTKLYYQLSTNDLATDSIIYGNWKEKSVNKGISDKTPTLVNDNRSLQNQFDFQKITGSPKIESPLFAPGFAGDYNFGSISFTADGLQAFFTKNQNTAKGVKQLEIWSTRRVNNGWNAAVKLYFNNPSYSYFHPAITPGGERLFFVSDQPGGIGGTDIYYVNKREDGSWDATVNAGAGINTAGNELFPTFYEGNLYFSSNGHEGLGGLDIYKFKNTGVENLGKPVNSEKDDLGFSARDQKGYFSSNRYGSDDIFSYAYKLVQISINGEVTIDSLKKPGLIVKLISKGTDGSKAGTIIDSMLTGSTGNYAFNVRPNREYQLLIEDRNGNKSVQDIGSNGYVNLNKDLGQFNFVTPKKVEPVIVSTKRTFISVVDSLKSVTKDFIMVHHDFDKVNIVKQDKNIYNQLQDRLQDLRGVTIVVVSATDCFGTDEYNEALSSRRTQKIKKDLAKYGGNNFVLMPVGEKQLIMGCAESDKDKNKQLENRYSYVFVIK